MLNPFYWYSVIWTVILVVYCMYLSNIQPLLSLPTLIFLVSTIVISGLLGYKFKNKYKFIKQEIAFDQKIWMILGITVLLHIIEFLYCRQIPLFDVISGRVGYAQYTGIPTFHVVLVAFTMFYAIYLAYLYLIMKNKNYIIGFGILVGMLLLLLSRSLVFIVLMTVILMLFSMMKFNKKRILIFIILIILGMICFGILGNLRSGVRWNDHNFITVVGEIKKEDWLPDIFNWTYLYLTTPLANLEYNIQEFNPLYSPSVYIIENLIPDFITKRLIINSTPILLVNPAFTVSTAYAQAHNSLGIIGMYLLFTFYSCVNIAYVYIVNENSKFYTVGIACLTTLMMLTFFVNSYMYSGWSFILVFPIIWLLYVELQKLYKKKYSKN